MRPDRVEADRKRVGHVLLSMTGYGDARVARERIVLHTELRSVNNRFFKLQCRIPDRYAAFEAPLEKLIKQSISRGNVTLSINRSLESSAASATFDEAVIRDYLEQWQSLRKRGGEVPKLRASELLELPGVVIERENEQDSADDEWALVEQSLAAALDKFQIFRASEGQSMSDDLRSQLATIETELAKIAQKSPQVVSQYRDRILVRVSELLKESGVELQATDLIREVSLFADRCDINEEIIRLRSHLGLFGKFIESGQPEGKRLDFLTQEMNREVNTIGSKANDVEIAHFVVEMKGAVEKIREILQNVE
jgi:uncharacterized protein (TIGR00255 family)